MREIERYEKLVEVYSVIDKLKSEIKDLKKCFPDATLEDGIEYCCAVLACTDGYERDIYKET